MSNTYKQYSSDVKIVIAIGLLFISVAVLAEINRRLLAVLDFYRITVVYDVYKEIVRETDKSVVEYASDVELLPSEDLNAISWFISSYHDEQKKRVNSRKALKLSIEEGREHVDFMKQLYFRSRVHAMAVEIKDITGASSSKGVTTAEAEKKIADALEQGHMEDFIEVSSEVLPYIYTHATREKPVKLTLGELCAKLLDFDESRILLRDIVNQSVDTGGELNPSALHEL